MFDLPIEDLWHCSTENENWKRQTDLFLRARDCFYVEVDPSSINLLPDGALVGAGIMTSTSRRHIVIARVKTNGEYHGFEVEHDPAGKMTKHREIAPHSIVLFCDLKK